MCLCFDDRRSGNFVCICVYVCVCVYIPGSVSYWYLSMVVHVCVSLYTCDHCLVVSLVFFYVHVVACVPLCDSLLVRAYVFRMSWCVFQAYYGRVMF